MALGIGLLGAGRIGQVHASTISSTARATLVAVADPIDSAARDLHKKYGCDIRSIDQIENSDDIDAVFVCTPTDTHADLIERFCRAGKAVFCEKPIDLEIQRVKECLRVVHDCSGTLMVGFNRRFDPDFMALKVALDSGRIGDVEMVTITSRDPGLPPYDYLERSGGIFRDMTIHDFDIGRWLLGEEIETIQASASVLVDPKVAEAGDYDSASVILTTPSGKQCLISNSRRATYGYDQRIEVLGSKGMAKAENTRQANMELADTDGFHRPPLLSFFMTRYTAAYGNEATAFIQAVKDKTQPPTTGEDGLIALALAEGAGLSVKEGRRVRLSEILD
jgi:myo-inositol 2-dehydrogenase/D-chiro-inositol 1-dehydrogenase